MTERDELVNGINDLVGSDRTQLEANKFENLIKSLETKRSDLRQSFLVNLPLNYTDDKQFQALCCQIKDFSKRITNLHNDEYQLNETIQNYCDKTNLTAIDTDLKPLLIRSITIERFIAIIKCEIRIKTIKSKLDSQLIELNSKIEENESTEMKLKKIKKDKIDSSSSSSASTSTSGVGGPSTPSNDLVNASIRLQKNIEEMTESTIGVYLELKEMYETIQTTKCSQLLTKLEEQIQHYNKKISSILINQFEKILKLISNHQNDKDTMSSSSTMATDTSTFKNTFSFGDKSSSGSTKLSPLNLLQQQREREDELKKEIIKTKETNEKRLQLCAKQLIQIQFNLNKHNNNSLILINLLVGPLEKRFIFHFCGNRKTNNPDKPEWFLSQLLKWVKDHEDLLTRVIQPIFTDSTPCNAVFEFAKALIELADQKLAIDTNSLLQNTNRFSHFIDEILLFDKQLKNYLDSQLAINDQYLNNYEDDDISCLNLMCSRRPLLFAQWLHLERQSCQKKVDRMFATFNASSVAAVTNSTTSLLDGGGQFLSSVLTTDRFLASKKSSNNSKEDEEIWKCSYSDVDTMKPPQCAETFMMLIKSITSKLI
jgi:hypothetical protein